MANINDKLNKIINSIFGKDVRQALYDGLDTVNKETENTTAKQQHLENTFDQLVINAGTSNAEIVDARVDKTTGKGYSKVGERMDEVSAHLEQKANKNKLEDIVVNIEDFPKINVETSDTPRIQRAIDYAKDNNLCRVFPTTRIYYISQPIKLYENIVIEGKNGAGMFANNNNLTVFKLSDNSNCNMFEVNNNVKFAKIKNVYLAGNKTNNTSGSGIYISDNTPQECQLKLEDCVVFDFAEHGVYVGVNRRAVKITNSTILQNGKSGININSSDCTIDKCLIGLNVEDGIQVRGYVTKILNCDIFTNKTGINVYSAGKNTMISNCAVDRNNRHGIYINAENCTVIGGSVRTNSQETDSVYPNIQVQDVEVTIVGVTFSYDGGYTKKPNYDIVVGGAGKVNSFGNITDGTSSLNGYVNDRLKIVGLKQNYYYNSIPTSGIWKTGDYVENSVVNELGTSGTKYIILGWKRLTMGSANVLNTDWLECRASTGN